MENLLRKTNRDYLIQIIVPIYNEGRNVFVLYQALKQALVEFDSLRFVYDLDSDTSLSFIAELSADDARVVADKNQYGRGVVNALKWGFAHSKPGPVIVMMGDNSDKLSIVPEMVRMWEQGAVVVSPSRYMPGGVQHGGPWLKTLMSKTAGKFIGLLGFPTSDPTNNFKLYDGQWLADQKIESVGGFEIALELCYKAHATNKKITQLPTEWFDRTEGQSNFKLWKWLPKYLKWYFLALKSVLSKGTVPSVPKG
jgi:dolichol-phosphate mannosyltransferase